MVDLRQATCEALRTQGVALLGEPMRFVGMVTDLIDTESAEARVLYSACEGPVLAPFSRALAEGTSRALGSAAAEASLWMREERLLDATICERVALQIAQGCADYLDIDASGIVGGAATVAAGMPGVAYASQSDYVTSNNSWAKSTSSNLPRVSDEPPMTGRETPATSYAGSSAGQLYYQAQAPARHARPTPQNTSTVQVAPTPQVTPVQQVAPTPQTTGGWQGAQLPQYVPEPQPIPAPQPQPRSKLPYILTGVAAAALVVLAGVFFFLRPTEPGNSDTSTASAPAQEQTADAQDATEKSDAQASEETYYLGVDRGCVAVYASDEATPREVSDVYVSDLSAASAAAIDAHTEYGTYDEVYTALEAYAEEAAATQQARAEQEQAEAEAAATAQAEADAKAREEAEANAAAEEAEKAAQEAGKQGPPVFTDAQASSYLSSAGQAGTYYAEHVLDGGFATAWVEGNTSSEGAGEWVTISASSAQFVKGVSIVNGYPKSDTIFWENNRPSSVTIQLSDGYSQTLTLEDGHYREWQNFDFVDYHQTTYIKLTINSVYPGSRWNDTCICEIRGF